MDGTDRKERPPPPADLCGCSEAAFTPGPEPSDLRRLALRLVGLTAVGLGLAGVFLPLLPTTPFLLVAAWAFGRSSPRLHAWLRSHRRLGPFIDNWERKRAVPRGAKALAVGSMAGSWGLLWLNDMSGLALAGSGACLAAVAVWLLSRPAA